jgi:hypothetical protein
MKPFYASALVFLAVCSLWVVADTPYPQHHAVAKSYPSASFGSIGTLHH